MSEEVFSFSDLLKQAESASGGFSPIPNGEYDVEIDTSEARKTANGKSKISVRYKVLSGPHASRIVFDDHIITPGNPTAMTIFFRKMSAMGLKSEYFAANPPLEKVAQDLAGRKIRVKVGTRTWQNVERNSVLAIMPFAGGQTVAPGLPSAPSFAPPSPAAPAPSLVPPVPTPVAPPVPVPAPPVVTPPAAEVPAAPEPEPADIPAPPAVTPAPSLPF